PPARSLPDGEDRLNERTGEPGPVRDSFAEPQAVYDVNVVGAGLAGLYAGWLAARRGARVLVLARGQGNLQLGAGTINIWARGAQGEPAADPIAEVASLVDSGKNGAPHPLHVAGLAVLRAAVDSLQRLFVAANYPLVGVLDHNHFLPT